MAEKKLPPTDVAVVEEVPPKSKRDLLRERVIKRYPDRNFDNDDDLYDQIAADYDETDEQLAKYRSDEEKIGKLFDSDPRAGAFLMDWMDGENPVVILVRKYGTDFVDYMNDPAHQEEVAKAQQDYLDRVSNEAKFEEEYKKNLDESLQNIDDATEANGWDEEKVNAALKKLGEMLDDYLHGKFTPESVQLLMNANDFDAAVATAEQEGEVRGRNANIAERMRKRKAGDGTIHLDGKTGRPSKSISQRSIFDLASEA